MKVDLFFCGDSNTYGEELQGKENDHKKRIQKRYSSLVSDKLGKTHCNLSESGASNDWIVKTTVEWFERGGKCNTAIIQFSHYCRWGWYDEDGKYWNIGNQKAGPRCINDKMKNAHSNYYESIWSEQLALDNYWKNKFFLKNYLKDKCEKVIWMTLGGIPYGEGEHYKLNPWQIHCGDMEIGEQKRIIRANTCDKIDNDVFTGSHPNEEGHQNIANWILERL